MKAVIAVVAGLAAGTLLAGCENQPYAMGTSVRQMEVAQTDREVPPDNVGGSLSGIADRVGHAYRSTIDSPADVKAQQPTVFMLGQ